MPPERGLRLTADDVARFARFSGDRNPLHGDPEFAASTAFGVPIVHGALLVLGMLASLPEAALATVTELRASFAGPVFPGVPATLRATHIRGDSWEVTLTARGKAVARVLARAAGPGVAADVEDVAEEPAPMHAQPAVRSAQELTPGLVVGGEYRCDPEVHALARRLGAGALDRRLVEGLAWSSYLVGMELPGLHSLFAGLRLSVVGQTGSGALATHRTVLTEHDARTGRLSLEGVARTGDPEAAVRAQIDCFVLAPSPAPDPTLGVPAAEGERGAVVVIGASRGFGASLTLALLAHGYSVYAVYRVSAQRARELMQLAGLRASRLHLLAADARDPAAMAELAGTLSAVNAPLQGLVLSAAAPPLAMGLTAQSAPELADYVAESLRLAAVPLGALLALVDNHDGWVLMCSSSAMEAPPRDWPHYVSAKAALEGLAAWVAATNPRLRTVVVRPPKMQTAMTNTPSGRIGAARAEEIAARMADQLALGGLPAGLTTLRPDVQEAATV